VTDDAERVGLVTLVIDGAALTPYLQHVDQTGVMCI